MPFQSKMLAARLLPYRHCVEGCVMSLYCLTNPLPEDQRLLATGRYRERFYGFLCKHCGRTYFVTDGPLWEGPRVQGQFSELVVALPEIEWESIPHQCRRAESNMHVRVYASKGSRKYTCPDCKWINYVG